MALEQLLSLMGFVLVMVGTPGPNNVMLMASGVKFGIRRSIPHLLGIAVGCQLLILAAAVGVSRLIILIPGFATGLQAICVAFLVYLAWKLFRSSSQVDTAAAEQPIHFWQAMLFQWVNPKAWMICLAMVSTYIEPARLIATTGWTSFIFLLVGTPIMILWNASGVALKNWLKQGTRMLCFNRLMVVLLIASLYPMLFS